MVLGSWHVMLAQSEQPSVTLSSERFPISFSINSWDIDITPPNLDNSHSISALRLLLASIKGNGRMTLDSVNVAVYTSPDGIPANNKVLALRRVASVRNYLNNTCGVPDSLVTYSYNSTPWSMLRSLIADSEYPWRDEALDILNSVSDTADAGNMRCIDALKALDGGSAWPVIASDMLPKLRSAVIVTYFSTTPYAESSGSDKPYVPYEPTGNSEPSPEPEPSVTDFKMPYDRFAIKSNVAYLAAGVANLGAEVAVSDHWSIDLPVVYTPYTWARGYRLRFLYAQPEARYWLDRPLKGHFFGVHANIGVANVSLDNKNRYQTPDGFYGAGISYGFALPIARRWTLEFTVGAGYFYTEYDTYYNIGIPQGMRYEKDRPFNYWGIDKLGINVVYRFGDKSGKRKEVKEQ